MMLSENSMLLIFVIYFILSAILRFDSRMPIVAALLLLITTPFLLNAGKFGLADTTAIAAYYFLVTGVLLQLIEYIREKRNDVDAD
jgi:hypothetical protein